MDTLTKHQLHQAEFLVAIAKNNINLHLARHFSDHALLEIGKNVVENNANCDFSLLVPKYLAELRTQLNSIHPGREAILLDCLEGECEYPLEVIHEMTPRQKINNYLIWSGIQGFTDDILDAISAAYGIILEPDLDR
jgi:hypothetical protein